VTLLWLIVIIGTAGAVLAGAMAWIITYGEYVKHSFPSRAPAIHAATQMAVATFVFFVGLSAVLGWVLQRMLATP
jgi:hypothetical protein